MSDPEAGLEGAAWADAAVLQDRPGGERRGGWTAASVYTLAFLTLISTFNYFDRSVLSLVLPLIKREMRLTDTALGVLSSVVMVYAVVGVPVGALADRWSRRNVIGLGFAFWSLMTALTGFAGNVWQLGTARLLMAVGESCGVAPSNAMLSRIFSRRSLALAVAIFGCGSSIALIAFSPLAGVIADHYGWRAAFLLAGLPGLVLAPVFLLTVKEAGRSAAPTAEDRAGFRETWAFLAGSPSFLLMIAGAGFMGAYIYGVGAWAATFLVRVHHLSLTTVGAVIMPIRGAVNVPGILLGGVLADWLARHDERWRGWAAGLACLLLAPCEALFVFGGPAPLWVAGMIGSSFFAIMHQPAIYAAIMRVARPRMRATGVAIDLLAATVFGQVVGPILIGGLNDALTHRFGPLAIRYSMGVVILCAVLGGLCFLASARFIPQDARRASAA